MAPTNFVTLLYPSTLHAGALAKRPQFPGYDVSRDFNYAGLGGSYWLLTYGNPGTIPMDWRATDVLPCQWTSPTSASDTGCATPAITDVWFGFLNAQPGDHLTITCTTNLGATGTLTLDSASTNTVQPITSRTEWITKAFVAGTIGGGSHNGLRIGGTVNANLPQSVPVGTPYQRPNTYTGPNTPSQNLFLENCTIDDTLWHDGTVVVTTNSGGWQSKCGYLTVHVTAAIFSATKSMLDSAQQPGGQTTVIAGVTRWLATPATLLPIIADLLSTDLMYVPGQSLQELRGSTSPWTEPYLLPSNMKTEVIDNYKRAGRQLVRFSWPGDPGLPPNSPAVGMSFRVRVPPSAPVGTRQNTVMAFDANFVSPPTIRRVTPGEAATYRVSVRIAGTTATGSIPLTNAVAYGILPYVGDTGVGPAAGQPRGSQWGTILTGPVTVPDDPSAVIEYSTSTNPCRGEVFAPGASRSSGPAGCVDDWTTTPPPDLATVRSIRVEYGSLQWTAGDTHPFLIPVTAPTTAAGIAWKSVALAGRRADDQTWLLPVEPAGTGLETSYSPTLSQQGPTACLLPGSDVAFTLTARSITPPLAYTGVDTAGIGGFALALLFGGFLLLAVAALRKRVRRQH